MMCKDRVAVVTGAAGAGVGRSTALTLAREGAKVVVNYRSSAKQAEAVVKHIRSRAGTAVAVQADVFTADGCKALIDAATKQFSQVDICVINPGAGWHPEKPDQLNAAAALQDAHAELAPIYHLLPLLLPGMCQRKWGRIVGVSLAAADSPSYAYNVAKAAQTQARAAAPQVGPQARRAGQRRRAQRDPGHPQPEGGHRAVRPRKGLAAPQGAFAAGHRGRDRVPLLGRGPIRLRV